MKIAGVYDMRERTDGQIIPAGPFTSGLTAVVIIGGMLTLFFERQVLTVQRKPMREPYTNLGPFHIRSAAADAAAAAGLEEIAYLVSTGTWGAEEHAKTPDSSPDRELFAHLQGRTLDEVKLFPDGLTLQFGDYLLIVTPHQVGLTRIHKIAPSDDTAAQC